MNASRLRELKERTQMTNQEISDISGVPLPTVNRLLSGQTPNPSLDAVATIVKAMGGSLDDVCDIPPTDPHKLEDNERLILLYREALGDRARQIRCKDKWIKTLVGLCLLFIFIIIFCLAYDILNTGIGYIR